MNRRRREGMSRGDQGEKPAAMTARFLHDKVLKITARVPKGRALDIPCGQGALAKRLSAQGFDVFCGDLDPGWYRIEGGHFHQVNLNGYLPYKDQTFDCVTCVEGIEHLENPHLLIREIGRVLKTTGRVVITTPNIMNIKSRLYFLLRSYFDDFRHFSQPSDQRELLGLHINPIPFGELKYILNRCGFRIEAVSSNRYTSKYPLLMPFLIPLIRFMTRRKNREARFLLRRELLEGDILIVAAIKEDGRPVSQ
jgi:SAM-dependent methyltransferase